MILVIAGLGAACSDSTEPGAPSPASLTPTSLTPLTATSLSGPVGMAFAPAPTVQVKDQMGRAMPAVEVVFDFFEESVTAPTRTASVLTDINGAASASWTLGTTVGIYRVVAKAVGIPSVAFSATAHAGPVAQLTAIGDVQHGLVGASVSPVVVRVADRFANPIPGVAVAFAVVSGGGAVAANAAISDAQGIARSGSWTLGMANGMQQLRASAGSAVALFTAYAHVPESELLPATVELCTVMCPVDGQLAFVRDGNIYQVTPRGTDQVQLTRSGTDWSPAWSPNGRRIAFTRSTDDRSPPGIQVMDADGANVVPLTTGQHATQPTWSPDGGRIAFQGFCNEGHTCLLVTSASPDGTSPGRPFNRFGFHGGPAWSPDGKRIAFVSDYAMYDMAYDIYVTTLDGSSITPLTTETKAPPDFHDYLNPAWSPDGSRIAFVYRRGVDSADVRFVVAVMNADGSGKRDLAWTSDIPNVVGAGSIAWSPDGRAIAFTSTGCELPVAETGCAPVSSIRYVMVETRQQGLIVGNAHSPSWKR